MNKVKEILQSNVKYRSEVPIPKDGEINDCENALDTVLQDDYKQFLKLDGLSDLRFHNQVLSPSEIIENKKYINQNNYYPFASNKCGDLYCFSSDDLHVYFWNHEENTISKASNCFIDWLKENRF